MKFNHIDDRIGRTMVLKEDVFLWFKHLDATSRLSVMHGLLNMCHPVELRFLGNCLEDLCKKDYLVMREREIKANNAAELLKLIDLNDDGVRTQLIVSVALLQASNRACATTIFNTLISYVPMSAVVAGEDAERGARLVTEIFLLMNMALMHPAFTFEQKRTIEHHLKLVEDQFPCRDSVMLAAVESDFNQPVYYQPPVEIATTLTQERGTVFNCSCVETVDPSGSNSNVAIGSTLATNLEVSYPTTTCCSASLTESAPPSRGSSCSTKSSTVSTGSPKAHIKTLELKNVPRRRKSHKYRIQVTWSNGEVTEISKTHQELVNFHQQLISFQDEPGHKERYIPYFTGPKPFVGNRSDDPTDEGMGKMADYLKQLMVKVPHHLLGSDFVTKFFRGQTVSSVSTNNVSQTSNCESGEGVGQRNSQQTTGTFSSSSSSSLSSSSSVSLPATPPPAVSNMTTVSNSANSSSDTMVDNVDLKMKSLTIYNSHQNLDGLHTNIRTQQSVLDVSSQSNNDDRFLEQIFFRDRMAKDLEELRKKFDKKKMLYLTETDLLKEGYDAKKAKQIISRFEAYKSQYPNGVICYGLENVHYAHVAITNCDVTTPPPPVVMQMPCNAVHPVQNQIFMPDATLDCIANYAMAPIAFVDMDRSTITTPDLSTPSSPAERYVVCNGTTDRVESPHMVTGTGYPQASSGKGFEIGGVNRPQSVNGSRSAAGHQRSMNKGRVGNRRESVTSSVKPTNSNHESSNVVGTGELIEAPTSINAVSPPATTNCKVEVVFTSASVVFTQSDNSHSIGKAVPSFTATTSVTYSVSQQHQQQQVIGSHQHQAPLHLASGMTTMGVPRLPSRPATLTPNLCDCSRAPPLPPTLPHMSYTYMPFITSVYPGFPQPPGNQTTYITTHSTNGYVPAAHPSVQPPNYYTPLQSPDCLSTEMNIPGAITNRFPIQPSGGTVVTQPPPSPGMIARTTVQHTSMPPPPSPVPGFLTGPTPNVGFHGNQIPVMPVATQLPLCGLNPSIPNYVITNPNVRLKPSCYNCGHCGHQGSECTETTMDEASRGSQYRLSFHPDDINVDGCD